MNALAKHPALLAARAIAAAKVAKLAPPPRPVALLATLAYPPRPLSAAENKARELRKFLRRLDATTSRWRAA